VSGFQNQWMVSQKSPTWWQLLLQWKWLILVQIL
jgi:hypothetical protein